jgi:hypothetical protein
MLRALPAALAISPRGLMPLEPCPRCGKTIRQTTIEHTKTVLDIMIRNALDEAREDFFRLIANAPERGFEPGDRTRKSAGKASSCASGKREFRPKAYGLACLYPEANCRKLVSWPKPHPYTGLPMSEAFELVGD